MSVTLRKLAQEVIRLESGGDPSNDSQLSEAYVILMLRQASNKFLQAKVYEKLNEDDRSGLHLMIATYTVSVTGDSPNKYITLPEFYMSLPFNKGLHAIAPVEDPTNFFIPRHNPSVSMNLPCADLDPGQYSYWTKGLRVYFDGDQVDFGAVLVDLVVASPDNIGADDSLPVFPENQADIIMLVRQMLSNRPIQDKILDNNADIGVKTR